MKVVNIAPDTQITMATIRMIGKLVPKRYGYILFVRHCGAILVVPGFIGALMGAHLELEPTNFTLSIFRIVQLLQAVTQQQRLF